MVHSFSMPSITEANYRPICARWVEPYQPSTDRRLTVERHKPKIANNVRSESSLIHRWFTQIELQTAFSNAAFFRIALEYGKLAPPGRPRPVKVREPRLPTA